MKTAPSSFYQPEWAPMSWPAPLHLQESAFSAAAGGMASEKAKRQYAEYMRQRDERVIALVGESRCIQRAKIKGYDHESRRVLAVMADEIYHQEGARK